MIQQDIVDIMLTSVSNLEQLVKRGAFEGSAVKPAIRANDTTDIWRHRGATYTARRRVPSAPHRWTRAKALTDLGLYSITFNNDIEWDWLSLEAFAEFREDATANGFSYFLEVFNPNVGDARDEDMPRFVNDAIVRALAGLTEAERPRFLKIAYNGPRALDELASFDPSLVVGVLGGGAGTTRDCFELIHQAEKYGARVALFGRKINLAESPLDIVHFMRAVADGEISPSEAVRAYHGELARARIKPHRDLEADDVVTEAVLKSAEAEDERAARHRHGGHLVRRSQQDDPALARRGYDEHLSRGRSSGRRLRLQHGDRPETARSRLSRRDGGRRRRRRRRAVSARRMRALRHRTFAADLAGRRDDAVLRLLQFAGERPAHASVLSRPRQRPDARRFRFPAFRRASCISACRARTPSSTRPGARDSTGWATVLKRARAAGPDDQSRNGVDDARKGRARFGRSCAPHLDLLIVNDYEIGAVADVETRDASGAARAKVVPSLARGARTRGRSDSRWRISRKGRSPATRDGAAFALGSVAMPRREIAGVNGAGDAFAAGVLYGFHEGFDRGLPAARPRVRGGVDARGADDTGVETVAECLALAERWGMRPTPA